MQSEADRESAAERRLLGVLAARRRLAVTTLQRLTGWSGAQREPLATRNTVPLMRVHLPLAASGARSLDPRIGGGRTGTVWSPVERFWWHRLVPQRGMLSRRWRVPPASPQAVVEGSRYAAVSLTLEPADRKESVDQTGVDRPSEAILTEPTERPGQPETTPSRLPVDGPETTTSSLSSDEPATTPLSLSSDEPATTTRRLPLDERATTTSNAPAGDPPPPALVRRIADAVGPGSDPRAVADADLDRSPADEVAPLAAALVQRRGRPAGLVGRAISASGTLPSRVVGWPSRAARLAHLDSWASAADKAPIPTRQPWPPTQPVRPVVAVQPAGLLQAMLAVHRAAVAPADRALHFAAKVRSEHFASSDVRLGERWRVRPPPTPPADRPARDTIEPDQTHVPRLEVADTLNRDVAAVAQAEGRAAPHTSVLAAVLERLTRRVSRSEQAQTFPSHDARRADVPLRVAEVVASYGDSILPEPPPPADAPSGGVPRGDSTSRGVVSQVAPQSSDGTPSQAPSAPPLPLFGGLLGRIGRRVQRADAIRQHPLTMTESAPATLALPNAADRPTSTRAESVTDQPLPAVTQPPALIAPILDAPVGDRLPGGATRLPPTLEPGATWPRVHPTIAESTPQGVVVHTPAWRPAPRATPPSPSTRINQVLPGRPAESSDVELADVIRRLPPPMAAAALAAGVLGEMAADRAVRDTHMPPIGMPRLEPAVPPAHMEYPTRGPDFSHAPVAEDSSYAGDQSVPTSALSARGALESVPPYNRATPAAAWDPPVRTQHAPLSPSGPPAAGWSPAPNLAPSSPAAALVAGGMAAAPLDRDVATVSSSGAVQSAPSAEAHPTSGGPPEDKELDKLADEVLDKLRWRLAVERERLMG